MWTLALKLARSGDYGSCRQILKELENQGFSAARRWLDASEHDRLDRLCTEARMPKREKRLTDEQQKAKALSLWENEGGQSQNAETPAATLNQMGPAGA
jgi:hypothetical protein